MEEYGDNWAEKPVLVLYLDEVVFDLTPWHRTTCYSG